MSRVSGACRSILRIFLLGSFLTLLAAAPAAAAEVTLTANMMTVDARTRVVEASGSVRITDGTTVVTAARVRVDMRNRTALLTEGRVKGTQGTLDGDRMTVYFNSKKLTRVVARGEASLEMGPRVVDANEIDLLLERDQLLASGAVRLFTPPDVVVTGSRLNYERGTGKVRLAGPVTAQSAQGVLTARELEGSVGLEQATFRGDVRGKFGDISATADAATLYAKDEKVVLTGDVHVVQGGRELRSPRVTVFYRTRKVVAEGPTKLRLDDQGRQDQDERRP
jgi:lipopolysaccharide export system protein LptA